MENQKIINLLNDNNNNSERFLTRKCYIINDQNFGVYGQGSENDTTIKFEIKVINPNLCDYPDAYILVTGNIENEVADSKVAFKNCAPVRKCIVHINDEHVETAEKLDTVMPIYNLLEYSDNYEDSSGSLYQFKRDEIEGSADITVDNSSSFKYKSSLLENQVNSVIIVVPLKYVSNFFKLLKCH